MKKFLIIGNKNAITQKGFFPLIKDNKVWFGHNVPKDFSINGEPTTRINEISRWFTNMENLKHNSPLPLTQKYSPEKYPKYDNYDAINVDKTKDIPCDYYGVMGVPVSFLDKYSPEQFEILGGFNYRSLNTVDVKKGEIYGTPVKIETSKSLFNGPVVNGKAVYFRILIKRK